MALAVFGAEFPQRDMWHVGMCGGGRRRGDGGDFGRGRAGNGIGFGTVLKRCGNTGGLSRGATTGTIRPVKHIPPPLLDHSAHECTTATIALG